MGNVKTITDNLPQPAQVTTFNYDDLNRLKDATLPGDYAQAWNYNPIGNMRTFTDTGNVKNYFYADATHKHAVTQVGSNYFCYDPNGNMVKRNATNATCTSGGDALTYDVENRLTNITTGITQTNYTYNGDGARVKKQVNGVTTYYVGALYEYTTWDGGNSSSKYYYFGSQRIAVKQDIYISYLHGDHPSILRDKPGQHEQDYWRKHEHPGLLSLWRNPHHQRHGANRLWIHGAET